MIAAGGLFCFKRIKEIFELIDVETKKTLILEEDDKGRTALDIFKQKLKKFNFGKPAKKANEIVKLLSGK